MFPRSFPKRVWTLILILLFCLSFSILPKAPVRFRKGRSIELDHPDKQKNDQKSYIPKIIHQSWKSRDLPSVQSLPSI